MTTPSCRNSALSTPCGVTAHRYSPRPRPVPDHPRHAPLWWWFRHATNPFRPPASFEDIAPTIDGHARPEVVGAHRRPFAPAADRRSRWRRASLCRSHPVHRNRIPDAAGIGDAGRGKSNQEKIREALRVYNIDRVTDRVTVKEALLKQSPGGTPVRRRGCRRIWLRRFRTGRSRITTIWRRALQDGGHRGSCGEAAVRRGAGTAKPVERACMGSSTTCSSDRARLSPPPLSPIATEQFRPSVTK